MSSNRTVAVIIVALLHVVIGYALVTGLAYNVIKKAAEDLKTFDVEDEPPPPPEEPPPPPEEPQPQVEPPPMAPPPMVRSNVQTPQIQTSDIPNPNPQPIPLPTRELPPPPPPPPPPPRVSQAARAKGSLPGLIRDDDYPESARDRNEQGTVGVRLTIGTNGRVAGCSVTRSSGHTSLDNTTCRILSSRARFTPAVDQNGAPIQDSVSTNITWRLVD